MATNQVIFDQIYKVLESVRSWLRDNYDQGKISEIDKMVHFRRPDPESNRVVKCEDDDEGTVGVTVSWDNNNSDLRTLSREVMHYLNE